MSETNSTENATESKSVDNTDGQQILEENRILIAYFTWSENVADTSGVDATASASVQPPGNVAQMSAWIQQEVGGELFSIKVEEPYPADYDACLERAADEKAENARPKLTVKVSDISEYDTVFLGYGDLFLCIQDYLSGGRIRKIKGEQGRLFVRSSLLP